MQQAHSVVFRQALLDGLIQNYFGVSFEKGCADESSRRGRRVHLGVRTLRSFLVLVLFDRIDALRLQRFFLFFDYFRHLRGELGLPPIFLEAKPALFELLRDSVRVVCSAIRKTIVRRIMLVDHYG